MSDTPTICNSIEDPAWVFGYGSIIWRPDFPSCARAVGWVENHTRRFWQGSPDHRGTPDALGRVVTLVPSAGERCWGVAYKLPRGREGEVMAYLDHRERGGYVRLGVEFTVAPAEVMKEMGITGFEEDNAAVLAELAGLEGADTPARIRATTYIASPTNAHYLGPAPVPDMVAQIAFARGESGRNAEYVLNLASHLREMGLEDEHIQALADGVKSAVERGECISPVIGLKPLAMA